MMIRSVLCMTLALASIIPAGRQVLAQSPHSGGLTAAAWTRGEISARRASRPKAQARPYQGLWGTNAAACREQDGVDRMEINGNRFFWYETRCQAQGIKAVSRTSWTMRMACQGEGQTFRARPRLTLATPNRLIMDASPVGPTKRQTYVRCPAKH